MVWCGLENTSSSEILSDDAKRVLVVMATLVEGGALLKEEGEGGVSLETEA